MLADAGTPATTRVPPFPPIPNGSAGIVVSHNLPYETEVDADAGSYDMCNDRAAVAATRLRAAINWSREDSLSGFGDAPV